MPDATSERWLPIDGYPNYEVSDQGRIWSRPRPGTRGGILKLYLNVRCGYLYVTLTRDGIQKDYRVNRLVARAFIGPCPEGQQVRHLDGDSLRNVASNLAYGTPKENAEDKRRHGRVYESNKTECVNGHPFDEENTRQTGRQRICLSCQRAAGRAYYRRQRGKGLRPVPLMADLTPERAARRREIGQEASRRYRERKRAAAEVQA